jgi:hypothetical protein
MNCDRCDKPFEEGDEVQVVVRGQYVKGKTMQTEPREVVHEECPEEACEECGHYLNMEGHAEGCPLDEEVDA